MANNTFQLNYDEMTSIAKQFKDDGEDVARLHSDTRQRVQALHKEWIGEAAEKFFEEMDAELLPALQRLSLALFRTQDVSNEIMKIIQGADEETVGFFRDQLSGDDFGASQFDAALNGAGSDPGSIGTPTGGGGSTPDDFGASKFGDATPGNESTPSDQGGGQEHNTETSGGGGGGGGGSDKQPKEQPETPTETESTSGGGGGGGNTSNSSQGIQGDLKNMGAGFGDGTQQNAASGGGSTDMPDHVYSGSGTPDTSNAQPQQNQTGSGNPDQPEQSGGGAAGVAGSVGVAAAGAAAKIIKDQKDKTSE